jgi:hypothetical protein
MARTLWAATHLLARSVATHRVWGITAAEVPAAVLARIHARPIADIILRAWITWVPLRHFSGVRMFGIFILV